MFLIRADGNAETGAGHLMRCMTIADELQKYADGRRILFVCADRQSAEAVQNRGYDAFVLESDFRDMEAELPAWERIPMDSNKENIIVVDSYHVTKTYLSRLGEYGSVTLLDDMGEERFPVDRVINYNAFAHRGHYESLYGDFGTKLVLGSGYVPVRPQFRGVSYTVRERVENILITTGGGDIDNIAGRVLAKMQETFTEGGENAHRDINYHMVIGEFNPHFVEMKALERRQPAVHIYHNVRDMAALMCRCDLAVTAGGSTVYELAAIGVPLICFSYAENQERMTDYLEKSQIAFSAGAYHKDPGGVLERIARQTAALAGDRGKREECYVKERKLADGLGAERLAKILAAWGERA